MTPVQKREKIYWMIDEDFFFKLITLGNDFLDMTPEAQATKERIDKLDIIKI